MFTVTACECSSFHHCFIFLLDNKKKIKTRGKRNVRSVLSAAISRALPVYWLTFFADLGSFIFMVFNSRLRWEFIIKLPVTWTTFALQNFRLSVDVKSITGCISWRQAICLNWKIHWTGYTSGLSRCSCLSARNLWFLPWRTISCFAVNRTKRSMSDYGWLKFNNNNDEEKTVCILPNKLR